jgi:hypothetical protein
LDIAQKYKAHVETVLYFREKYLEAMNWKENNKRFLQASQGVCLFVLLCPLSNDASIGHDRLGIDKSQHFKGTRCRKTKEITFVLCKLFGFPAT